MNFFYMRYGFLVFVYTLCIVYNKVIGEMASFATSLIGKRDKTRKGIFPW